MPFKPVGVDENGKFPSRVRAALDKDYVKKPAGIKHGEVPVWDANTQSWTSNSVVVEAPTKIDGGSPGR